MDNLEKRLLSNLRLDERFDDEREFENRVRMLKGPIKSFKGENWVKWIPDAIETDWDSMPLSTRLTVWILSTEIEGAEFIAADFKQAYYDSSR